MLCRTTRHASPPLFPPLLEFPSLCDRFAKSTALYRVANGTTAAAFITWPVNLFQSWFNYVRKTEYCLRWMLSVTTIKLNKINSYLLCKSKFTKIFISSNSAHKAQLNSTKILPQMTFIGSSLSGLRRRRISEKYVYTDSYVYEIFD